MPPLPPPLRRYLLSLALALGPFCCAQAQERAARVLVRDSLTQEPLVGASVGVPGTGTGAQTDVTGAATISPPPPAGTVLTVTALGYRTQRLRLPAAGAPATVRLVPAAEQIAEVVVTATRTNSRLEDLPTRVEVLGAEEMQEENGIKPGNIASLLGDIAGTQIQPTSPTTGNADLRIQGLQGRYSQILRDGLPLLGGAAGSFGILQIPPLDLRQIELIKGSSSTLYGGGAIAGLVNLVSKTPTLGTPQRALTLNQSTLSESNVNGFAAARNQRVGYTLYGGLTRQQAVDVDGDGFVDVPRLLNLTAHPRLFWYPNRRSQLAVGYTGTAESRRGGDARRLRQGPDAGPGHEYFVTNLLQRHALDAIYTQDSLGGGSLTLKGTASGFSRTVRTNTVAFTARQLSYFGEASYLRRLGRRHTLVGGLSLTGEQLRPATGSATPLRSAYTYATVGGFAQDDWQLLPPLTVQAGLRLDHHNRYGRVLLPRLAVLYKATPALTVRLNGGAGYRAPVPYVNELDERDYPRVLPLAGQPLERSVGLNGDVNWTRAFGAAAHLTLNQGFFYTRLNHPSVLVPAVAADLLRWQAQARPVVSQGLETYVRLQADDTELYLGYVLTAARRRYDDAHPALPLAARHKLAAVLVQEFSEHWGAGIEASYTGRQYLDDGETTPGYPLVAALVRYRTGPWTAVLNGENLLDYRQTRREAVVLPPLDNPAFRPLWAPVEGRVVNVSVNWKFRAQR